MNALLLFTSAFKWGRLLRALGIFIPLNLLLKLYTIGFFIGLFLPGVVGGDVVRCYLVGQDGGRRLKVVATIVAERITGVASLVLMCLLALVWDSARLATLPTVVLLGGISSALVGGIVLSLNRRLASGLMYRTRRHRIRFAMRPLYQLYRTLYDFPRKPLLAALGYSFIFYLEAGLTLFLICKAFGVHISFVEATSVQMLICLLTLIPISLGGLGLTQAGDVYLLGILGVDVAHALGISFVRLLMNYGCGMIGGILFIQWQRCQDISEDVDLELSKP
jgi:uncharacterized protein (TIRG00374 family)